MCSRVESRNCVLSGVCIAATVFLLLSPAVRAEDCPTPNEEVYTPSNFPLHQEPLIPLCCCYDNDIYVVGSLIDPIEENDCCGFEIAGCETDSVYILRGARAVVLDGPMNEWVGGQIVYTTVPEWTLDVMCFCPGGVATLCEHVADGGTLYDFSCVTCPPE